MSCPPNRWRPDLLAAAALALAALWLGPVAHASEVGTLYIVSEPEAEVLWEGISLGATDSRGTLAIREIPLGEYAIVLRKAGFRERSQRVVITAGERTVALGLERLPPPPEPRRGTPRPVPAPETVEAPPPPPAREEAPRATPPAPPPAPREAPRRPASVAPPRVAEEPPPEDAPAIAPAEAAEAAEVKEAAEAAEAADHAAESSEPAAEVQQREAAALAGEDAEGRRGNLGALAALLLGGGAVAALIVTGLRRHHKSRRSSRRSSPSSRRPPVTRQRVLASEGASGGSTFLVDLQRRERILETLRGHGLDRTGTETVEMKALIGGSEADLNDEGEES